MNLISKSNQRVQDNNSQKITCWFDSGYFFVAIFLNQDMNSQAFTFSNLQIQILYTVHLNTHLNIWICIHKTQYKVQRKLRYSMEIIIFSASAASVMKQADVTYVRFDTADRFHIGLATGLCSWKVVWYIPAALLILVTITVHPINTFCSQSSDVWALSQYLVKLCPREDGEQQVQVGKTPFCFQSYSSSSSSVQSSIPLSVSLPHCFCVFPGLCYNYFHCFLPVLPQQDATSFLGSSYNHSAVGCRCQTVLIQPEGDRDRECDDWSDGKLEIRADDKTIGQQQRQQCFLCIQPHTYNTYRNNSPCRVDSRCHQCIQLACMAAECCFLCSLCPGEKRV